MFLVFFLGISLCIGMLVPVVLATWGAIWLIGKPFGLWLGEQDYKVWKSKRDWWRSLSRADRQAFNARERRKRQFVKMMQKVHDEVTRRQQEYYDKTGALDAWDCTRLANEVWREWRMDDWNDINLAKDRPATAWSQGGGIRYRHERKSAWTPPVWR